MASQKTGHARQYREKKTLRSTISFSPLSYVFSHKYISLSLFFSRPSFSSFISLLTSASASMGKLFDRPRATPRFRSLEGKENSLCSDFVERSRESADEERR